MAAAAERVVWAVDQLDLVPGMQVLEVAAGHGVAAGLIADRVGDGHVVAVDRSPKMSAACRRRNAEHLAAGRLTVVTCEVADLNLPGHTFDRILAVHLPVLQRGDPDAELAALRRHVAVDGRLVVAFQPLDAARLDAEVERVGRHLETRAWPVVEVRRGDVTGGPTAAVVAAP
ncbi:class I SAM-dependent methyltransferase [Egicoccus sp. AB-alg2]|uniref:class I SAM-dependent methyltransferase n=1 Tax=Egicoccus sp. AB-alg2 TaxID=3242693 RepID=UPI00359DEEAE